MKQTALIAAALCLIMLTTVGAGIVAAKQDANPRQAGSSSVYFYDVAATDTHGTGKLQIDVAKHTFVFNGKDFTPSAQIELKAKQAGSTDYVVFAAGQATPSGNLHIAGTWEAAAAPAEVVGGYTSIQGLQIDNYGWFVARLACYYSQDGGVTWQESSHSKDITLGYSKAANLCDLGVPDGALVKIHIIVVAGKDRTGSEVFQYRYVQEHQGEFYYVHAYANYDIYGTTFNPTLYYTGISRVSE